MELPASAVVVCEANKTRADLYGLWLDDYETRRALTSAQFLEAFDAGVAVVVLDDSFGEEGPEPVLERVESEASHCRVLGLRRRSSGGPESGYDRELERPVFEADLTACIETLSCRANYHLLLDQYYRTTVMISTYEWQADDDPADDDPADDDPADDDPADDDPADDDRYERLRARAERLQEYLNGLRPRMSDEDVRAAAKSIAVSGTADVDAEESVESKYRPDECGRCGQDWSEPIDGGDAVAKLGAYVWRCVSCGHVDMRADPNYRHIGSFRR
ncbi:response regulator receiver protein [Halorubrum sp. N11]|uniref:response regulator receiver protein n=1 Tax=Halorubrum sp. N11 TaxID=3402276 RepID=UPI003EBF9129